MLAATANNVDAVNRVYNVAYGEKTSLNQLFYEIRDNFVLYKPEIEALQPEYGPFRKGDVRHSHADISRAKQLLGYNPKYSLAKGLKEYATWYTENSLKDQI